MTKSMFNKIIHITASPQINSKRYGEKKVMTRYYEYSRSRTSKCINCRTEIELKSVAKNQKLNVIIHDANGRFLLQRAILYNQDYLIACKRTLRWPEKIMAFSVYEIGVNREETANGSNKRKRVALTAFDGHSVVRKRHYRQ